MICARLPVVFKKLTLHCASNSQDFSGLWEDEAGDAIWSTSKPLHAVLEGVEETLLQQGGDGVPQC